MTNFNIRYLHLFVFSFSPQLSDERRSYIYKPICLLNSMQIHISEWWSCFPQKQIIVMGAVEKLYQSNATYCLAHYRNKKVGYIAVGTVRKVYLFIDVPSLCSAENKVMAVGTLGKLFESVDILFSGILFIFLQSGSFKAFGVLFDDIVTEYDTSNTYAGWILTLQASASFIVGRYHFRPSPPPCRIFQIRWQTPNCEAVNFSITHMSVHQNTHAGLNKTITLFPQQCIYVSRIHPYLRHPHYPF